jgi:L-threonylcarbamoyladenylate synthase
VIDLQSDTFYGLGANHCDLAAVLRNKELKGRDEAKPILVLVSDRDQVQRFIDQPSLEFQRLAREFWPGPLTLIGAARSEVPDEITAGTRTIGIRLPADEDVRNLVQACGGALTATSANPSSKPAAKTAGEVAAYFPAGVDLIIDGGASRSHQPSTVLDVSGEIVQLIREGAISMPDLLHRSST